MKSSRPLAIPALILALALPAAGCGGGDDADNQFREDYNAAVEKLSEINSDIGSAGATAAGQSNNKIAQEFERIADTAEQTRQDLSELEPPEDAKDAFDQLLSALKQGVADLRAVAKAAVANDPAAAAEAVQALSESGQAITDAENELKQAVDG
jgi:hypothetical protein